MSYNSALQGLLEDWFFEFYGMLREDNPDLDHEQCANLAEQLTMEKLANEGQYDYR